MRGTYSWNAEKLRLVLFGRARHSVRAVFRSRFTTRYIVTKTARRDMPAVGSGEKENAPIESKTL